MFQLRGASIILLLIVAALNVKGKELSEFVSFSDKTGCFTIASPKMSGMLIHFGPGWQGASQAGLQMSPGFPKRESGNFQMEGSFQSGGSRIPLFTSVEAVSDGDKTFTYKASIKPQQTVESETMALQIRLDTTKGIPELNIDGTPLHIPETVGRTVFWDRPARKLYISAAGNVICISGLYTLFIQDSRTGGSLVLRLIPLNMKRNISEWNLQVNFTLLKQDEFPRPAETQAKPVVMKADEAWLALDFDGRVLAGSPLDFSERVESPAGKYGPIVISGDGHFVFRDAPEKRIRFLGINVVGNVCFLPREEADRLVQTFASLGYNSVRLHHFDNLLVVPGAADSTTLSPEMLDKLHYLTAKLKARGIYTTIDLYCSRQFKAGDRIPPEFSKSQGFKGLLNISSEARDNWKTFVWNLMTVKNPYTGLSWAEDPAVFAVSLVNENGVNLRYNATPELGKRHEEEFTAYLKQKGIEPVPGQSTRDGLFLEFLNELQESCIDEQVSFLRDKIKYKGLITDLNYPANATLAGNRAKMDFVDTHDYWDHPQYFEGGSVPSYKCESALRLKARLLQWLMPRRIFGKPYTVSEFNYCQPNPYRMELAPMMGAYAGLQDWDGIWRFVWSESLYSMKPGAPRVFEIINDPQARLSELILCLLFRRGDVEAARPAFAWEFKKDWVRQLVGKPKDAGYYLGSFSELGLYGRIGTVVGSKYPGKLIKVNPDSEKANQLLAEAQSKVNGEYVVSSTDQIHLDAKNGTIKVVTPYSEVMTTSGAIAGNIMKIADANGLQTVALLSLDDKKLTESRRMLLIQLPDIGAANRKLLCGERTSVLDWGKLPLLVRKATAQVELELSGKMKIEMLKLNGESIGVVSTRYSDGKLRFTIDTGYKPGGVMAYYLSAP